MTGLGLRETNGNPAAPPYTSDAYSWDANLTLSGTLTQSGTTTLSGTTTISGAATFSSTAQFDGAVTFTSTMTFGDAAADTLTVNGAMTCNADVDMTFTDDENLTITTTDTTAGASAPLVMTTTLSGVGVTGGRALFHTKFAHQCGLWVNALKGYLEITGTGGHTLGLASAVVAEMKFAARASLSGAYYPLEIEVVCPGTLSFLGTSASNAGFIYARVSGTTTNWEAEAWFMFVPDLTGYAGNMLSANSQTLKCAFGTSTTPVERYMVFSQAEDCLSLNTCATAIILGDSVTTTGIQIGDVPTGILLDGSFTSGIRMVGGVSYNPIHIGVKGNASEGLILTASNGEDMGGILVFCTDGAVDLTNSWTTSPIWTRYVITADQTSNTATGAYLQLKTQGARALTSCDYSAIKAYCEVNGTMALTTSGLSVINVTLEYAGNINNASGTLAGIKLDINDKGSYSITDTALDSAAILIEKNGSGSLGWPVGVKINDAGAVTGIQIVASTTGVRIDNCPTGISFTNAGATGEHLIDVVDEYAGLIIETGSYSSSADSAVKVNSTNARPASFLFDDGGDVAAGGGDIRCLLSRLAVTAEQTGCSMAAIRGQSKICGAVDFDGYHLVGVEGYIEMAGANDISLGADGSAVAAFRGRIEVSTSMTHATANTYMTAFYADLKCATAVTITQSSGVLAAVVIEASNSDGNPTAPDAWGHGIFIADSATDTGITIGTTTTGINFTGTITDGISFASATPSYGTNNAFIDIGTYTTQKVIAATDVFIPIQVNLGSNANYSGDIAACRFRVDNITNPQASVNSHVIQTRKKISKNVNVFSSIQTDINIEDAMVATLHSYGIVAKIRGDSALTGSYSIVYVDCGHTGGASGTTYGVHVNVEASTTLTHGMHVGGQATSTMTNMMYYNSVGAVTSVIKCVTPATYFIDWGQETAGYLSAGGTDCTASGATDPATTIKVRLPPAQGSGTGYIRVWAAP